MHTDIKIGVDSWVIQDGNYGDFAVGEKSAFALEFCGAELVSSNKRVAELRNVKNSIYRVCGEIIYARPNVWVIDIGIKIFWENSPPNFASVGDWVEGEIFLGIDPFFYKEYLHKEEGIPNLTYCWSITRIERNDTPWLVAKNPHGGKRLTRDQSQERWIDINVTNAWEDDDGRAGYVIHIDQCEC